MKDAFVSAHGEKPWLAPEDHSSKHAVVVGGGWGGFGAAYALLKAGVKVTILDASETPGGLSAGWRTPGGRSVEAGIKGFWYQYSNINALVGELGIDNPFTDWTRSSFWAPDGLQVMPYLSEHAALQLFAVQSPIFQNQPRLPTPLGSFLYTSPYFTKLPIWDRLTALPLLGPLLEVDSSEEAYNHYDQISALDLFKKKGVSQRLLSSFGNKIEGPMQADFDVRWCKGPVVERLFKPLIAEIESMGGQILGGRRVQQVHTQGRLTGASQHLIAATAQELARVSNLSTVDVAAVRLWLDKLVQPDTPSNVMAGFDQGVGATFFDLNTLQVLLHELVLQDEYRQEAGSVVEVDYYNATSLLGLTDEQLIQRTLHTYLAACQPAYGLCQVRDASVLRFAGAVTAFAPGSHASMPPTGVSLAGVFMAGDWLAQGPGTHGAKGLSQEKAYVTGLQAGNQAAQMLSHTPQVKVLPVEADEAHIVSAKQAVKQTRSAFSMMPYSA
ncbi:MAG: hypothetical protein FRX49_11820 [Trebouxia sp. A1-2]|nr:MAG: hypothetical protein FRX49_13413 [Trebouxia sp. A1-2]KAA6418162.1 MAG: hypothetical protein FRX49_11820 [Trebouxia sp. A1-2]